MLYMSGLEHLVKPTALASGAVLTRKRSFQQTASRSNKQAFNVYSSTTASGIASRDSLQQEEIGKAA
jgi:hypothetical protein